VISPALFSMMVMMALVTTFMTRPLLAMICPKHMLDIPGERGEAEGVEPTTIESGKGAVA